MLPVHNDNVNIQEQCVVEKLIVDLYCAPAGTSRRRDANKLSGISVALILEVLYVGVLLFSRRAKRHT